MRMNLAAHVKGTTLFSETTVPIEQVTVGEPMDSSLISPSIPSNIIREGTAVTLTAYPSSEVEPLRFMVCVVALL